MAVLLQIQASRCGLLRVRLPGPVCLRPPMCRKKGGRWDLTAYNSDTTYRSLVRQTVFGTGGKYRSHQSERPLTRKKTFLAHSRPPILAYKASRLSNLTMNHQQESRSWLIRLAERIPGIRKHRKMAEPNRFRANNVIEHRYATGEVLQMELLKLGFDKKDIKIRV